MSVDRKTLPTILAAHLHVCGSEIHTLYKLTERDDVVFATGFLPACDQLPATAEGLILALESES